MQGYDRVRGKVDRQIDRRGMRGKGSRRESRVGAGE